MMCAETVKPQPLAGLDVAQPERPITNNPRAQQRSHLWVRKTLGKRVGERLGHYRGLRVPTVHIPAREPSLLAEILLPFPAVGAFSASPVNPGHAHAVALTEGANSGAHRIHHADYLMSGNQRRFPQRQIAFHRVQVGTADAASAHANANLASARNRHGKLAQLERVLLRGFLLFKHHRTHSRRRVYPIKLLPRKRESGAGLRVASSPRDWEDEASPTVAQ